MNKLKNVFVELSKTCMQRLFTAACRISERFRIIERFRISERLSSSHVKLCVFKHLHELTKIVIMVTFALFIFIGILGNCQQPGK